MQPKEIILFVVFYIIGLSLSAILIAMVPTRLLYEIKKTSGKIDISNKKQKRDLIFKYMVISLAIIVPIFISITIFVAQKAINGEISASFFQNLPTIFG